MKVRYIVTTEFEIEDELIKDWAESSIEYDYPDCIEHNIEECLAYHYDSDYVDIDNIGKSGIHLIKYSDNIDEIVNMAKVRGEKLLTKER